MTPAWTGAVAPAASAAAATRGRDSGPRGGPQSPCLSLAHAREATHGRKRFSWFENAMQFGSGSVFEAVGLVWCGLIDENTTSWFGAVLVWILHH